MNYMILLWLNNSLVTGLPPVNEFELPQDSHFTSVNPFTKSNNQRMEKKEAKP